MTFRTIPLSRLSRPSRGLRASIDMDAVRAILDALAAKSDEDLVRALGDRIGYGRTMQLAEELWRERLPRDGLPVGGELTVGPCAAALVPCVCEREDRHLCAWCCGTGRVTRRVREAAEAAGPARPPTGG